MQKDPTGARRVSRGRSRKKAETGGGRDTLFNREAYETNKTSIAVTMSHFFLRYLNLLYREFDGDLLLPVVLGEIAHHNIVRSFSSHGMCRDIRDHIGDEAGIRRNLVPTNAYSISEATGIPRETVRRKIAKLVKKGWIVKNPRGELTISATVGNHFTSDFNIRLLDELLEATECIRQLLEPKPSTQARPRV